MKKKNVFPPLNEKNKLIFVSRCDDPKSSKAAKFTYRILLDKLLKLTKKQLEQKVQILGDEINHDDGSVRLEPVLALDTIEKLCHVGSEISTPTHSVIDFQHHPEQVVLLRDGSPFSEDGDTFFMMMEDGSLVGNVSGKIKKFLSKKKK